MIQPSQSNHRTGALLLCLATMAFAAAGHAGENQLGYSYGSETEAMGEVEVSQWVTQRTGKIDGSYRATDLTTEFDYGLTDRLEAELELSGTAYRVRNVRGLSDLDRTAFTGMGAALKYALRDVDRDGYGLSLYVEPEYSRVDHASGGAEDAYGFETKLIFQRERGPWTYIANIVVEPEWVKEPDGAGHELEAGLNHGLSYRFSRRWFVGVENVWRTEYEPVRLVRLSRYAGYIGPTVHFEGKEWWFTLTWLRQGTGWPTTRRGLQLDEFERNELRLKVGFEL